MSTLFYILEMLTVILLYCGFVGLISFILWNFYGYYEDKKDEYLYKKDDIENWNHGKCRICGAQMVRMEYGFNPQFNDFRTYECSKDKEHPPIRIRKYVERFEDFEPITKEKE